MRRRDIRPEESCALLDRLPQLREHTRPRTYADCDAWPIDGAPVKLGIELPCPFVGCKYNTTLSITRRGAITGLAGPAAHAAGFTDAPDTAGTCVLRIADRGGVPLEAVGEALGLTRERVRQLEQSAIQKLRGTDLEK